MKPMKLIQKRTFSRSRRRSLRRKEEQSSLRRLRAEVVDSGAAQGYLNRKGFLNETVKKAASQVNNFLSSKDDEIRTIACTLLSQKFAMNDIPCITISLPIVTSQHLETYSSHLNHSFSASTTSTSPSALCDTAQHSGAILLTSQHFL